MDHHGNTLASAGYPGLIERLAAVQPPVYVFGGFAEDAVLGGTTTRPHDDVDVLVNRADLAEHLERFVEWGFPRFEIYFEVVPGSPLVYHSAADGIDLELGVYDELQSGRPSFVLPTDDGLTRVTLSSDCFTQPLGRIDGVPIRTISPLALYQMRSAFMHTGVFGPPRLKDEAAQAHLLANLLADMPTETLEPDFGPYLL